MECIGRRDGIQREALDDERRSVHHDREQHPGDVDAKHAFEGFASDVVIAGSDGVGAGRDGVCVRPATSVRSGLISTQVMPASDVFIMNCVS